MTYGCSAKAKGMGLMKHVTLCYKSLTGPKKLTQCAKLPSAVSSTELGDKTITTSDLPNHNAQCRQNDAKKT